MTRLLQRTNAYIVGSIPSCVSCSYDLVATMVFKWSFMCGCDQCMQMLDADIPYFHSIIYDMAISGTPVKTRYDAPSSTIIPEPTVQDAIHSVIFTRHMLYEGTRMMSIQRHQPFLEFASGQISPMMLMRRERSGHVELQ